MRISLVVLFLVFVGAIFAQNAYGHGVGSETLPPQMIGNYNSTIFIKSWPTIVDENIKEKQITLTIYDVETEEHLHDLKIDFQVSKHDQVLFSDTFEIEEGVFSMVFSPNQTIINPLESIFANVDSNQMEQIQIHQDIFSEGGLYDFDIVVTSVDSFENILDEPVHFVGSISIPQKFDFETENGAQVSVTTFYDVIEDFSISENSIKFSMPFVWSEENISQIAVVHEEIHVPKSMSSWITNDYDLKINGIAASDSLITIDDYSIEEERIIHVILPQSSLQDYVDNSDRMDLEILANAVPKLPLISPTTNNQYDVSLSWDPPRPVWQTPITFDIKIEDTFVPDKIEKKIPFDITIINENEILFEKRIIGVKNSESADNLFEFIFDKEHEGSIQIIIDNIDSNKYAETKFAFVVNSPTLKFPISIPSMNPDGSEGRYDVDMTWIPTDLMPDQESEFIFTIYQKDSKIPVFDAYYEFVLIRNGQEIMQRSGVASGGGSYEEVIFSEEDSGQILVRLEKINDSEEYAEISVNVVPEFGVISIMILTISLVIVLIVMKPRSSFSLYPN